MRPTNLTGRGSFALILLTMLFLFTSASVIAQEVAKGQVTNAGGKPLEGVTILLKQKNISTTTAPDGGFSIPAAKGAVLTVSWVSKRRNISWPIFPVSTLCCRKESTTWTMLL